MGGEEEDAIVVAVMGDEAKKLSVEAESEDGGEILDRFEPVWEDVMME